MAFVLGLGAIASLATIVRVPYVVTLTQTNDFLFATVDVAIWSTVEPGVGITVVSLATLRPLFRSCLERAGLKSDTRSRSRAYARRSGYHKSSNTGSANTGTGRFVSDNRFFADKKDCTCDRQRGICTCRPTFLEDGTPPEMDPERGMTLGAMAPRAYITSSREHSPPGVGRQAILTTTSLSTVEEPYDWGPRPLNGRQLPTREGLPMLDDIERPSTARTRNDSIKNDSIRNGVSQQRSYHAF